MTYTALPQFTAAAIARLRGDSHFMTLVTKVYDEVPETPVYPYALIDLPSETPDRTFGQNGHASSLMLSIFTQNPSTARGGTGKAGFVVGLAIAEAALALLTDIEGNPLSIADHDVVDVDVTSVDAFREADGKTRRVDVVITATLEDSAS